jgi:hypothetical protein
MFDKIYTNLSHYRGHINVVLVLQSCTDSQQLLPGLSTDTFPTPSDCTYGVCNITVDEDVDVIKESVIAVNKQTDTGIKQEEIYGDLAFPDIKAELNEVSRESEREREIRQFLCVGFLYQI